jgi:hypothetical protein
VKWSVIERYLIDSWGTEEKEQHMIKGRAANRFKRIAPVFLAVLMTNVFAGAQQIPKPSGVNSPQIESELRSGGNFHSSFASSEFAADGGTVIQGAPFSAVGIKETTQILSDGRRITRRMAQSIYRDGEGRTRHEWGNETKSQTTSSRFPIIYDAITGTLYFGGRALGSQSPGKNAPQRKVKIITPQSPPDDITKVLGETVERLGTKIIEGIEAEGLRVTSTIPATGNNTQQSNKIVLEQWYSQQLRRNILIKVIDPRFGEASYRLTKIDRDEPSRELFLITTDRKSGSMMSRESGAGLESHVPVSARLERGGKVTVDNRTTGRIVIIGWDKDMVEARATSERGIEAVRFALGGGDDDSPVKSLWLKADYAKGEAPTGSRPADSVSAPAPDIPSLPASLPSQIRTPGAVPNYDGTIEPPMRDKRPLEVHLEVRVPRYAEIEVIKVTRSNVEVTGVETPLAILGDKSDVVLRNVGAVEVRTHTGAVEVENASGLVDIVTASGPIRVRNAQGDVRVLSINGQVEIGCVRGRVNIDSTSGPVKLDNVFGDVDANTSNGDVFLTGALRKDGRYHLKSMSGVVEMSLRDNPPGFTAALSSYRGLIENQFQLKIKQASSPEEAINRRIIGRYGDGQAQITLDTFDGKVKLSKLEPGAVKDCQ